MEQIPRQVKNLKNDNIRRKMAIAASKGLYEDWIKLRPFALGGMFRDAYDKEACKIAAEYNKQDFLEKLANFSPLVRDNYLQRYKSKYKSE